MWEIEYLISANEECPTLEFLNGLHKTTELPYVKNRLDLLEEFGDQLRRPISAPLRNHIYELRIPIHRKQFRILYFFFYQDRIVTCQGFKKESKVPDSEIEKAIKYRAQYFATHERSR